MEGACCPRISFFATVITFLCPPRTKYDCQLSWCSVSNLRRVLVTSSALPSRSACDRRQLLLDVDFQGFAGNAISLLLRDEASLLQAAYLERLLSDAAMEARGLDALWIGVSAYTPSAWREHQARVDVPRRDARRDSGTHRVRALVAYMTADLELAIDETRVRRWLAELEPARLLLTEALAEGEDAESSSECMLLAIPFMPSRPDDLATIDELVCAFAKAVQVMPVPAREVLAEYGRRWEAIVDTKLPAGHPCFCQTPGTAPMG